MKIRRRDFLKLSGAAALSGGIIPAARAADNPSLYDLERFGDARILHLTDTHAQLQPVFFREPSVNIGIGEMMGKPPHLVGRAFLDHFKIGADSADAYAFTALDFEKSAARFGKLGGFAYLKTLIDKLRGDVGERNSLLLDGGDLWQGTRARQRHAGRRHGGGRQPARHRGDDRPLGVHLRRGGAAEKPRTLQGRVPGAERVPHRGSQVQRRQGFRSGLGPRVQAVRRSRRSAATASP